eukprot:116979-Prorocentrum_minimum.AAC.1
MKPLLSHSNTGELGSPTNLAEKVHSNYSYYEELVTQHGLSWKDPGLYRHSAQQIRGLQHGACCRPPVRDTRCTLWYSISYMLPIIVLWNVGGCHRRQIGDTPQHSVEGQEATCRRQNTRAYSAYPVPVVYNTHHVVDPKFVERCDDAVRGIFPGQAMLSDND